MTSTTTAGAPYKYAWEARFAEQLNDTSSLEMNRPAPQRTRLTLNKYLYQRVCLVSCRAGTSRLNFLQRISAKSHAS